MPQPDPQARFASYYEARCLRREQAGAVSPEQRGRLEAREIIRRDRLQREALERQWRLPCTLPAMEGSDGPA